MDLAGDLVVDWLSGQVGGSLLWLTVWLWVLYPDWIMLEVSCCSHDVDGSLGFGDDLVDILMGE